MTDPSPILRINKEYLKTNKSWLNDLFKQDINHQ